MGLKVLKKPKHRRVSIFQNVCHFLVCAKRLCIFTVHEKKFHLFLDFDMAFRWRILLLGKTVENFFKVMLVRRHFAQKLSIFCLKKKIRSFEKKNSIICLKKKFRSFEKKFRSFVWKKNFDHLSEKKFFDPLSEKKIFRSFVWKKNFDHLSEKIFRSKTFDLFA
jgi:hypothetical protein